MTRRVIQWGPSGDQWEREGAMGERRDVQLRVSAGAAEAIRRRAVAERRTVIAVVDGLVEAVGKPPVVEPRVPTRVPEPPDTKVPVPAEAPKREGPGEGVPGPGENPRNRYAEASASRGEERSPAPQGWGDALVDEVVEAERPKPVVWDGEIPAGLDPSSRARLERLRAKKA